MKAALRMNSLTFSDGGLIALPPSGVVVIVGPNNAGKSRALRDITSLCASNSVPGQVVTDLQLAFQGSSDDLVETLRRDSTLTSNAAGAEQVITQGNAATPLSLMTRAWGSRSNGPIASYFVHRADTESRLAASRPTRGADLFENQPSHPLHHVYVNRALEQSLDEIARESFGSGLVLDTWTGGEAWALRVGTPTDVPNSPRPTQEVLQSLKTLPLLHEQGDGVRSMLGLLLNFLTGHHSIGLIDEPEAFLHPPQAKYLGRLLSDHAASTGGQVVISTHSSDILHGVLEGAAPASVVRLVREGGVNHASVLDNANVEEFWSDPLLRYSRILEGLFSDGVLLCESEVDCQYFAAVLDASLDPQQRERRPDVHFTSCGGKHRMHVAVRALRAARVPVSVIADFDVLNDWAILSRLAAAAGCAVGTLEDDWRVVDSALRQEDRVPSVAALKDAVIGALDGVNGLYPEKRDLDDLKRVFRTENGWDRVKRVGLAGVPSGDANRACGRLLDVLARHGIHLVPVGEMENIVPSVGGHGAAWLASVLEAGLHQTESGVARQLVDAALSTIEAGVAESGGPEPAANEAGPSSTV